MDNIENKENNFESVKNVPKTYNNNNCNFNNNINFPNKFNGGNLKNPNIEPFLDVQGVNIPDMNNKFDNNLNNDMKFINQSMKGGQGFNRSANFGTNIASNIMYSNNLNYNTYNKLNNPQNINNNNKFNYNTPNQYTQNQLFNNNNSNNNFNYNQMGYNYNNTKYTNNYNTHQVNNYFKYNGYINFDASRLKKTNDEYEIYLKEHINHLKTKQNLEINNSEIFSNDRLNVYNNKLELVDYNFTETTCFKNLENLDSILLKNIEKMTFEKFTPIQKTVIPLIIDGHDIMGCSKTGSGKTAAFGIPIINLMLLRGPPKTSKIPSKIFNNLI